MQDKELNIKAASHFSNCHQGVLQDRQLANISPTSENSNNLKMTNKYPVYLEEENQELKSQVDTLKSALLVICQQQNIQHPLIEQLKPQKDVNSGKKSPFKRNVENQENIQEGSKQSQSQKRRKRQDRNMQQCCKNNNSSQIAFKDINEFPLQIPIQVQETKRSNELQKQKEQQEQDQKEQNLQLNQNAEQQNQNYFYKETSTQQVNDSQDFCSPRFDVQVSTTSPKVEEKSYYEQEISMLRQQLEEFAQEEEKIISKIYSRKDSIKSNEEYSLSLHQSSNKDETEEQQSNFKIIPQEITIQDSNIKLREKTSSKNSLCQQNQSQIELDSNNYLSIPQHDMFNQDLQKVNILTPQSARNSNSYFMSNLFSKPEPESCKNLNQSTSQQQPLTTDTIRQRRLNQIKESDSKQVINSNTPPRKRNLGTNKSLNLQRSQGDLGISSILQQVKNQNHQHQGRNSVYNSSRDFINCQSREKALTKGLKQQQEPEDEEFGSQYNFETPQIIKNTRLDTNNENIFETFSSQQSDYNITERSQAIFKAEQMLHQNTSPCNKRPDFLEKHQQEKLNKQMKEKEQQELQQDKFENLGEQQTFAPLNSQDQEKGSFLEAQSFNKQCNFNDISFQDNDICNTNILNTSDAQEVINIEIPSSSIQQNLKQQPTPSNNEPFIIYSYKTNPKLSSSRSQNTLFRKDNHAKKKQQTNQVQQNIYQSQEFTKKRLSVGAYRNNNRLLQSRECTQQLETSRDNQGRTSPMIYKTKQYQTQSNNISPIRSQYTDNNLNNMYSTADITKNFIEQDKDQYQTENLYDQRTKAVIKRREELQKKKLEEQKAKIEKKYEKIDNLRQSKNLRQKSTISKGKYQYQSKNNNNKDQQSQISYDDVQIIEQIPQPSRNVDKMSKNFYYRQSCPEKSQENYSSRIAYTNSQLSQKVNGFTSQRNNNDSKLNKSTSKEKFQTNAKYIKKNQSFIKNISNNKINKDQQQQYPQRLNQTIMNSVSNDGKQQLQPSYLKSQQCQLGQSQSFICNNGIKQQNNTHLNGKAIKSIQNRLKASISQQRLDKKKGLIRSKNIINTNKQSQEECENCQRLISQGLSTDFCLQHINTPRN